MLNEEMIQDICRSYYDCMLKTAFGFNYYKFTKLMEQLYLKYAKKGISENDFYKIVNDVVAKKGFTSNVRTSLYE